MRTAIVTGAKGAIGSHVCRQLTAQGYHVGGIGHEPPHQFGDVELHAWIDSDVNHAALDAVAKQLETVDLIIHLAGGSSVATAEEFPAQDFNRTVNATVNTLTWMRTQACRPKFVYASSAAIYGEAVGHAHQESDAPRPISIYGFHKMAAEQAIAFWCSRYGFKATIVRLFSVYGPGLRKQLVYHLCRELVNGQTKFNLGGTGGELRDWMFISDAAKLLVESAKWASTNTTIINGSSGLHTKVSTLCNLVAQQHRAPVEIVFSGQKRVGDPVDLVGNSDLARRFGFEPAISLVEGLIRTYRSVAAEAEHLETQ